MRTFLSTLRFLLTIAAVAASTPGGQAAMIIDSFDVGSIVVERTGATGVTQTQTGLAPSQVLGGVRTIQVGSSGGSQQKLTINAQPGELHFEAIQSLGYFTITYGSTSSPLNIDLTPHGNAFAVDFKYESPDPVIPLPTFRVLATTSAGAISSGGSGHSATSVVPLPGEGTRLIIPFSLFTTRSPADPLDFSSIERITLDFFRVADNTPLTISNFSVIPEPSSLCLLLTAAVLGGRARSAS